MTSKTNFDMRDINLHVLLSWEDTARLSRYGLGAGDVSVTIDTGLADGLFECSNLRGLFKSLQVSVALW